MRNMIRSAAWMLSVVLFLSTMAPTALAAEEQQVISISTAEDLTELSKKCSLDSWSRNKTIRLEKDISLIGVDYQPIPSFGGIFEGQGHTISGLTISESGNAQGMFRYIQPSGMVLDLTVEGVIEPSDRKNALGGIAGKNQGILANCTFSGEINGKNQLGGLVGVNEAEGQIINSRFLGSIQGEHYVGGIAGQNLGSIIQCENLGNVNTSEMDVSVEQEDFNKDQLNAAENAPVCTDIGGIAGFSSGILQNCQNSGSVGYEHIGYNIGGIAGRQTGYLDGCLNKGEIRGRKDVGGIAGQMEPELRLKYNAGKMGKLLDDLEDLQKLVDQTTNDLSMASDQTSSQIQTISDKAKTAHDLIGDLADSGTQWANDNLESIDNVSSRISWTLEHMLSVVNTGSDVMYQMKKLFGDLKEVLEEMDLAADLGEEAAKDFKEAMQDLQEAAERGKESLIHLKKAMEHLKNGLGRSAETAAAWEEIALSVAELHQNFEDMTAAYSRISQILQKSDLQTHPQWQEAAKQTQDLQAAGEAVSEGLRQMEQAVLNVADVFRQAGTSSVNLEDLGAAYQELKEANESLVQAVHALGQALADGIEGMKDLEAAGHQLGNVSDKCKELCDRMSHISFLLSDMGEDLSGIVEELVSRPSITIYPINEMMKDQQDALGEALDSLLDDGEMLNRFISDHSDLLVSDMKAINRQFGVITETLRDIINDPQEESIEDYFEDISEQEVTPQDTGYISHSENTGQIEGDINVAGIVGSMAVEYDFDPEDDLKKSGDRSPDFRYQAKAVVSACVNRGRITGKKDYTGGIVGRMDLGRISSCEGYGSVTGTDGNYVGGIAGASWGSIHDSWAKVRLSGNDYIGGIAGLGSTIQNCHTLPEVETGSAYIGAVAGWAEEDSILEQNTFTSETLGALDGISYAGKAEPVSFDTLCATEGIPAGFGELELTFTADGETVAVVPFRYGEGLETLPDIPQKEGYSASWPSLDYSFLTASQTLEAEYIPYISALSDEKALPDILVDGNFGNQAAISHTTEEVAWTDDKGIHHSGTAFTVTVQDPSLAGTSYTIHYRLPDKKKNYAVWVKMGEDQWSKREHTVDGQYLLFENPSSEVTFCVLEKESQTKWLIAALASGSAIGIAWALWHHRKKEQPDSGQISVESRSKK